MMNLDYIEQNKEITYFSSFRTKAFSRYFFEIKTLEDIDKLDEIITQCLNNNIKYSFIGAGTNLLFAFDEYNGLIIRNQLKSDRLVEPVVLNGASSIEVLSGDNVINTVNELIKLGYTKLSPLLGLPGTFGGALVGNAGCFGLEIKDIFISAKIYDIEKQEIFIINNDFLKFDYRKSFLKNNKRYFVISMILNLSGEENHDKIKDTLEKRKNTQPSGATCGSFFKNPKGDYAGRLIQEVGLKGKRLGGAIISDMHANFFVNIKNASYKDILDLRDLAKNKVQDKFGILLKEEVRIITN